MKEYQPGRFSLLQSPKTNAIFIGETPEQAIGAARVYDETHPAQTRIEPDYSRLITPAYRLIMGGVTDNAQFMRTISGCKEAREDFAREIGPGSPVRQRVQLTRNAEVLLDEEHEQRFRDFAKSAYQHDQGKRLKNAWGMGELYALNLGRVGSGIDKVLSQYRLPNGSKGISAGDFIAHRADNIFLPRSLMEGVVAAGLRYENDERQAMQEAQARAQEPTGHQFLRTLRSIFG